jgi:hypothetical protein
MSGLKLKKQKSTGDINDSPKRQTGSVRSTISSISHVSADSTQSGMTNASMYTDSNLVGMLKKPLMLLGGSEMPGHREHFVEHHSRVSFLSTIALDMYLKIYIIWLIYR